MNLKSLEACIELLDRLGNVRHAIRRASELRLIDDKVETITITAYDENRLPIGSRIEIERRDVEAVISVTLACLKGREADIVSEFAKHGVTVETA